MPQIEGLPDQGGSSEVTFTGSGEAHLDIAEALNEAAKLLLKESGYYLAAADKKLSAEQGAAERGGRLPRHEADVLRSLVSKGNDLRDKASTLNRLAQVFIDARDRADGEAGEGCTPDNLCPECAADAQDAIDGAERLLNGGRV